MKIGVIQFPGTNCERETMEAIRRAGMEPVAHRWNMASGRLETYDGFVIAGGFSYEDRSRSGVIAAQDPIMYAMKRESEKGKPILGICNGAQILLESGLVPGIEGYRQGAALTTNKRVNHGEILGTGFYNAWIIISFDGAPEGCAFTSALEDGESMRIPAAHAEGRFLIPDKLLSEMIKNKMTPFRYTDGQGNPIEDFPVNPNGSVYNIAGICNTSGNVMALMPHPERVPAGDKIFLSMRHYIERSRTEKPFMQHTFPLEYCTPQTEQASYQLPDEAEQMVIDMIITDNEAVSVENALRLRDIAVSVKRNTHWEILFDETADTKQRANVYDKIVQSGELFNSNKEFIAQNPANTRSRSYLVREREDCIGDHVFHALSSWFSIPHISSIRHGIIWTITPDDQTQGETIFELVEKTHLLGNPIAHRSMIYDIRT